MGQDKTSPRRDSFLFSGSHVGRRDAEKSRQQRGLFFSSAEKEETKKRRALPRRRHAPLWEMPSGAREKRANGRSVNGTDEAGACCEEHEGGVDASRDGSEAGVAVVIGSTGRGCCC